MKVNATIAEETVAADPSNDINIENSFSPAEEADEMETVQATSDQTQQKKPSGLIEQDGCVSCMVAWEKN